MVDGRAGRGCGTGGRRGGMNSRDSWGDGREKTEQYKYSTDSVCFGLFCSWPSDDQPDRCREVYPLPGTSCGNYKVCKNGHCVEDKKLGKPVKNEKCMFGDQNGPVLKDKRGDPYGKCSQFTQKNGYCYKGEKECCITCEKFRKSATGNCRFGETGVDHWINGTRVYDCPSAAKLLPGICYYDAKKCCETCPKHYKSGRGCNYGDYPIFSNRPIRVNDQKYFLCSEAVKKSPGICYDWKKECCESCKTVGNPSDPSCRYGDYPGKVISDVNKVRKTCSEVVTATNSWACYSSFYLKKCCASCKKFKTDVRGCEYGDKITTASRDRKRRKCSDIIKSADDAGECYTHDRYCCATCAKYKTADRSCEYGDKSGTLSKLGGKTCKAITNDTAAFCYDYNVKRQCCGSCGKYERKGGSGRCKYGDKQGKLRDLGDKTCKVITKDTAGYCYLYNVKNTCCGSCEQYKIPAYGPHCAYGNKIGKMRGKDVDCAAEANAAKCKDYYFKKHCCGSCFTINKG